MRTISPDREAAPRHDALGAPDTEAALLARMAEGEEAALVHLYERMAGSVHAVGLRILADGDEAEEATAECFWRLWSRASMYRPGRCSGIAWILTVARNCALDQRRRIERRGNMRRRLDADPTAGAGEVASALTTLSVRGALDALSHRDRELLEAAYYEGLSGAEIARREDLPLGTVKSRMRAALARLRNAYHRGTS